MQKLPSGFKGFLFISTLAALSIGAAPLGAQSLAPLADKISAKPAAPSSISSKPAIDSKRTSLSADNNKHLSIAGQLVKAGALNAAIDYLENNPPPLSALKARRAWAVQKWRIMILRQDWQALKKDAQQFGRQSNEAKYFSIPFQARAMIALNEFGGVQNLLQSALQIKTLPGETLQAIRAQLIAYYQAKTDYRNAKIEAIRYHDEFKPQEVDWFLQRALIEYLAGDVKGASRLLAPISSIDAQLLKAFFRYAITELKPSEAIAKIKQQLARKRITPEQKKLAYSLAAKISNQGSQAALSSQIGFLEQALVINDAANLYPDLVQFTPEDLKTAYLELADKLINLAQIDARRASLKFSLAQKIQLDEATNTIGARALYADILLDQNEIALGNAAKNELVSILIKAKQYALLTILFGQSSNENGQPPLGNYSNISSTHSANILNYALAQGDADLIANIAPYLGAAPENVDQRDWLLQKARIDIFAGRFKQGKRNISLWLAQGDVLTGEEVDRVLQPVYDLQAVHQNDLSIELFDLIRSQTNSKRHKREILFWKAQSFEDKGERITAAQYYLRSALVEANGFDDWGHSARYHAASNLMEAKSFTDARRLFEGLLNATIDPVRRNTIKQALQRLWLLENATN